MNEQNGEPFLGVDFYYSLGDFAILRTGYNLADLMEASAGSCPRIFMRAELIYEYVVQLINLQKPFVLITATNDDIAIPYFIYPNQNQSIEALTRQLLEESRMVAWYTKNPSIQHPRLHALPIGPKWNWHSTAFFGEDKSDHLAIFRQYGSSPLSNIIQAERKTSLVYTYFSHVTTDQTFYREHVGLRRKVHNQLLESGLIDATEEQKPVAFGKYMKDLSSYRFAISPPGRGIDTHRTWEALMVGTIPIVLNTTLTELYEDLPVLIVDSYAGLTRAHLEQEWQKLYLKIIRGDYKFERLYSDYWRKITTKHGSSIS
jgi:hypothetical protein